jgi:hypothetical protein
VPGDPPERSISTDDADTLSAPSATAGDGCLDHHDILTLRILIGVRNQAVPSRSAADSSSPGWSAVE